MNLKTQHRDQPGKATKDRQSFREQSSHLTTTLQIFRSLRRFSEITFLLLLISFLLVACSREAQTPTPTPTAALPAATDTPRPTLTPTVQPTPNSTPTPEPIIPAIIADDLILEDDGEIRIDQVVAAEPGWLVLFTDEDGETGEVLGMAAVEEGVNNDVVLVLDPFIVPDVIQAVLHADQGEVGEFEFPGPDSPVRVDGEIVSNTINIDLQVTFPAVTVPDQIVAQDGLVTIDRVTALEPGWLALHADEEGQMGPLLGFAPIEAGLNENVVITINYRVATPTLYAVLYKDEGELKRFEPPDTDSWVTVRSSPVTSTFTATLPPDIYILDQPVVDRTIVAERAISYGPGWLVVYLDDEGALGQIIGWAALEDGLNEQISVNLTTSTVTPNLHLVIHEDTETVGEFGFPGADLPVFFQDRLPDPTTFRTDAGNYLITRDQPLGEDNSVIIPLAVVDTTAWVVIQIEEDGQPGEIIAATWVPAGVNRDILIELDPEILTPTLYATLHLDTSEIEEFEYPDGRDVPLQRNRTEIRTPFTILEDE